MRESCLELDDSWKEPYWPALTVNDKKRFALCLVFKSASTTWLRILLRLTGNPRAIQLATSDRHRVHRKYGSFVTRLHQTNASARFRYLLGYYYKVMIVRDPVVRLISAYRDKMFRDSVYNNARHRIKRMFRVNVSTRWLEFIREWFFTKSDYNARFADCPSKIIHALQKSK